MLGTMLAVGNLMTPKQAVLTIVHTKFQAQPCAVTIYHSYYEPLEATSSCELLESVQTHSILVQNVGVLHIEIFSNRDSKVTVG